MLEQLPLIMFCILFPMVEAYTYWLMKMSFLSSHFVDEDLPMWGLPKLEEYPNSSELDHPVNYEASQLQTEHKSFFEDFSNSLTEETNLTENNPFINHDEDILSMNAWTEELDVPTVSPQLSATATACIEDYELGEQIWVVEIVGEERGFLHVSDGSARAWVDMTNFGQFIKGDILSLLVERNNDRSIEVINATILQRCSTDFLIPDEEKDMEILQTIA